MARLRVALTKEEPVRYISHLDYAKTIERALRRSKLPVAYSEGFNPHPKISFASALAVGVTSNSEYLDIELTEKIDLRQADLGLRANLCTGIHIAGAAYIDASSPALMSVINLASYKVEVLLNKGVSLEDAYSCVKEFNQAASLYYIKASPKRTKNINLKDYLAGDVAVSLNPANNYLKLEMFVKITPQGSAKPADILNALINTSRLPADGRSALIQRTGLYIEKNNVRLSPLDFGRV